MASKHETPAPSEGDIAELYSLRDVARIVGVSESRLRYWIQSGLLTPSVRRGGRFFYTFRDLVNAKAAVELVEAGIPPARIRAQMTALRAELPEGEAALTKLRICSDGARVVVVGDDATYEPTTGQLVMAFAVKSLGDHVARVLELPQPPREAAPPPETGYQLFLRGLAAEERGDDEAAAQAYRDAVAAEPGLASAHANLGVLGYRRGDRDAARAAFERALELDPELPEARFNLANLLEDLGETELAIAELRRVCWSAPDFADAHYNLGLLLARIGGVAQAQQHLERYLELDDRTEWAGRAREYLGSLSA
jgi:DNA-binding transcriptional MerR regulator